MDKYKTMRDLKEAAERGDPEAKARLDKLISDTKSDILEAISSPPDPEEIKAEYSRQVARAEALSELAGANGAANFARSLKDSEISEVLDKRTAESLISRLEVARKAKADGASNEKVDSLYNDALSVLMFSDAVTLWDYKQRQSPRRYRNRGKAQASSDILPSFDRLLTITDETLAGAERAPRGLSSPSGAIVLSKHDLPDDGVYLTKAKTLIVSVNGVETEFDPETVQKEYGVSATDYDWEFSDFVFSQMYKAYERVGFDEKKFPEIIEIYVPDMADKLTEERSFNYKEAPLVYAKKAEQFSLLRGYDRITKNFFPFMFWAGFDEERNTIRIGSPYYRNLILQLRQRSFERDKHGAIKQFPSGEPKTHAVVSYLCKSTLASRRNKAAAESVHEIIRIIEKTGNRKNKKGEYPVPHITWRELIDRNPLFRDAYANSQNQRRSLQRFAEALWRYLREDTLLTKKYPDIILPDPRYYPTPSTLDDVLKFPHGEPVKDWN